MTGDDPEMVDLDVARQAGGSPRLAAAWTAKLGPLFLPFAGLYALHLSWQASRVDPADGPLALRLFKSNRDAGVILFAGLVAGLWRGLSGL